MSKSTERTTGKDQDGDKVSFRVSKSDEGSTKTFHGYEGNNNPHTTEHSDGSWWKTDSDGGKTKTSDGGDSGK